MLSPTESNSGSVAAAFAPLRRTAFRKLWLATFLASLGAWAQVVGAGWLMLEVAGRADLVAYVQAANSAPVLLLSLLAGALADACERRSIQLSAQLWVVTGAGLLAAAVMWGSPGPATVLALTFATGIGGALRAPAWQAAIRDLVPDREVAAAVTLSSVGFNLSRILGPAVGGLIVAVSSPLGAFVFNVATSLLLILVLARMPAEPSPSAGGAAHLFANIRCGLSYVAHAAAPRTVLVRAAAIGIPSSATLALLPVLVHQRLGGSSLDYGLLLGCFGLGAVCSAFLLTAMRRRVRPETLLSGATLVFAASLLGLAGAGGRLPIGLALLGGGVAWVAMLTTLNTAMQFAAHVAFRGRALAAYMTCAFGGLMIGSLLWGRVAYLHGLTAAFVAAGLLLAATAVLRLAFSLPELAARE